MEYVEGVPLTEFCEHHASSILERLRLFRAVCEAVEHAHRHLIVHRDLKPSNILVKPDGSVKLLDFGIAKQLDSLEGPVDRTRTGLRLMTPAYAAPEQILGDPVGIHTDIYTLGVVLYELLTGRLPFDLSNRTPGEAETAIIKQGRERPSAAAKEKSISRRAWADLDVLCLTAMHIEPQRRYRTVEALIRDIDHYLAGEPLEARPDTFGYRIGKFVRRNWQPVSAAAASLLVVVSLVVFYTVRLATARNAAVAEAGRTQRIQRFMLNLFQGGDEAVGPADSLRVVTLLDRGVQEAQALDGEPAVQAELRETLGSIYQKLGKLERADSLLGAALDQRRSLFGPDNAEVARSLVALGRLRVDQAQDEEAERLARQGLEMSKRQLRPNDPAIASATLALGLTVLGRALRFEPQGNDEAGRLLQQALAIRERVFGKVHPQVASTLNDLGGVALARGRFDEAEALAKRVLAIYRTVYGRKHAFTGVGVANLASVYMKHNQYSQAEPLFREAIGIFTETQGAEHLNTGIARIKLGRTLLRQHRYAEAGGEALAGQQKLPKGAQRGGSRVGGGPKGPGGGYESDKQ